MAGRDGRLAAARRTLGAILGFAIGGALLLPIGFVYGRLVAAIPDAAAEIAYTAKVFPQPVSFATGWMMVLAYFIVCPWEAVAVRQNCGLYFSLRWIRLRCIALPAGRCILPHLVIGLGTDCIPHGAELSRYPAECHLSELDGFRNAGLFLLFVVSASARVRRETFLLCSPMAGLFQCCW